MSTDGPTAGAPRPPEDAAQPAMLNPKSLGCILPGVLAVIVLGLAWSGMQSIIGNTGKWSLTAADYGLASAGLPPQVKAPFTLEIQRLRVAYSDGSLDAQGVVKGVSGLLETRAIQLLVVDDLIVRRLPASQLTDDEKASIRAAMGTVAVCVDGGQIPLKSLLMILGPLAEVPEDGTEKDITDEDLKGIGERAVAALAKEEKGKKVVEVPEDPRAVDADAILGRFRAHIDETLAAEPAAPD